MRRTSTNEPPSTGTAISIGYHAYPTHNTCASFSHVFDIHLSRDVLVRFQSQKRENHGVLQTVLVMNIFISLVLRTSDVSSIFTPRTSTKNPRRTLEEPTSSHHSCYALGCSSIFTPRTSTKNPPPPGRFTPDPATFEGLFDYADAFLDDTVLGVEAIIDVLAPGTSIFSHFVECLYGAGGGGHH
jgi:hypothetical protein